MSLFHCTDLAGYKAIRSRVDWRFLASQPLGPHPFGAFFTPLNATAPAPARNKPAMQAIGAAMNRPSFFPTFGIMLWAGLGAVAAVVLESVRAVPKKALALGYQFKFPEIGGAMKDLLKK
jgi:NAD dependent epimerase/dehydratase family enzyme